jgi:hypothetical protein
VRPLLADDFFDDFVEEMRPGLHFVFRLHERGQASSPFDQGMIKGRIRLSPREHLRQRGGIAYRKIAGIGFA